MPSFHCTPDQREQSSREKEDGGEERKKKHPFLADFFPPLFHHLIVLSACKTTYSRRQRYLLRHSSSCWRNQTEQIRNDLRFRCEKEKEGKKNVKTRLAKRYKEAPGSEILHGTFVPSFIHSLTGRRKIYFNPVREAKYINKVTEREQQQFYLREMFFKCLIQCSFST